MECMARRGFVLLIYEKEVPIGTIANSWSHIVDQINFGIWRHVELWKIRFGQVNLYSFVTKCVFVNNHILHLLAR